MLGEEGREREREREEEIEKQTVSERGEKSEKVREGKREIDEDSETKVFKRNMRKVHISKHNYTYFYPIIITKYCTYMFLSDHIPHR